MRTKLGFGKGQKFVKHKYTHSAEIEIFSTTVLWKFHGRERLEKKKCLKSLLTGAIMMKNKLRTLGKGKSGGPRGMGGRLVSCWICCGLPWWPGSITGVTWSPGLLLLFLALSEHGSPHQAQGTASNENLVHNPTLCSPSPPWERRWGFYLPHRNSKKTSRK